MKNIQKRIYRGKTWKTEQKKKETQKLYWKIVFWVMAFVLVSITGTWNHYTQEYRKLSTEAIEAIKSNVKIEKVKAATLQIPEVTNGMKGEKKENLEQMVDRVVKETGFKWPSYLKRLINCESKWNPNTTNIHGNNPSSSKDRGLLQINSHWHSEVTDTQSYDPEWSVRWAIERINKGYQSEWACDRIIKSK